MFNYLLIIIYFIFRKKEGITMLVRLYASEIISGNIVFEEVPAKLQDGVTTYLLNIGLDQNGDPIAA